MGYKHLVILGAGSTIATIPNGDKNGNHAYTLNGFLKDPFFANFLDSLESKYTSKTDVEKMCAQLYVEDRRRYDEFETLIREKYESLQLPDEFTILERLVMSLTADDAIISFNWDDLIVQAYNKAKEFIPMTLLPNLYFPHGNAQACYNEHRYGSSRNPDNIGMKPSPLNMPIDDLEYKNDLFIKSQWNIMDWYVRYSQMITIFGYRGPSSDKQDLKHMESLLRQNQICGKIEIIDKTKESAHEVANNLKRLVRLTECEADCCGSFYESSIAQHPRQTLIKRFENYNYRPTMVPELSRFEFIKKIGPIVEREQVALDRNH